MKIIQSAEFDHYWKDLSVQQQDDGVSTVVMQVIAAVRNEGDEAVRWFATRFDKSSPDVFEVPQDTVQAAWHNLRDTEPELAVALELAADHIRRFSALQKSQFVNFETELAPGLITGQRVLPVQRAAVYVPGGRAPLISSVLMGVIPGVTAGVDEVFVASPPGEDGLPDPGIMAAAYLAGAKRVFALGGAQAIAALALGTETIPRVDVIVGPGNKYVATAKRLLFGAVGIDFVAGPTDVLIIADGSGSTADPSKTGSMAIDPADIAAADMLAQAEHDIDARARALVPNRELADCIAAALEKRLASLPTAATAKASLDAGGLIIIYDSREDALRIAHTIAPEHLELQVTDADSWIPLLRNYGSLFIGSRAAEVLGDYAAGINHTLPTAAGARFTGGLSVRHFLKTVTTLRCASGQGWDAALSAAERIARAEGLIGHAESAVSRKTWVESGCGSRTPGP
ncbi:MAG: histidinol dehydrogenase [Treponema sp.]|jgi:histidinol dehydrogenase|nr:histidinol dehydrogenase [Treponema sp.]